MINHKKVLTALILSSLCASAFSVNASDLPSFFDWRRTTTTDRTSSLTNNIIPVIRDQNILHGTCWTFAAFASYESNWNLQLRQAGNTTDSAPYFSSRYLSWLTYEPTLDNDPSTLQHFSPWGKTISTPDQIYSVGGTQQLVQAMLTRFGAVTNEQCPYSTGPMAGVDQVIAPTGLLHDMLGSFGNGNIHGYIKDNLAYYKELIKSYGALSMAMNPDWNRISPNMTEIYNDTATTVGHAMAIVGWDDDYVFKYFTDAQGNPLKGAWIVRNSYGTEINYGGHIIKVGDNGYHYMSYQDTSAQNGVVQIPELDSARYTQLNSVAKIYLPELFFSSKNSCSFASRLTSSASQLVKAVGFYASNDDMTYNISVRLKGSAPQEGTEVYAQSGTFGKDGLAPYKGYRTVDLNKFLYLPDKENYVITVTLTDKNGGTVYAWASQDGTWCISDRPVADNMTFVSVDGQWVDTKTYSTPYGFTNAAMILNGLAKNSEQANGGDFTVVSLNDNGAGGSEIYLGKKDELYKTDILHPDRRTLSNMTVELTKGSTDSWYGGVISGEGSVTKTGDGLLALSGANTYTGATNVNEGSLALTGSLHSPVTVASGATLTGTGTIDNSLTNRGTLVPGLTADAQSLLGNTAPIGTLTVTGDLTSSGALQIALNGTRNSQLAVGGTSALNGTALSLADGSTKPLANYNYTYLTSQGGITGNATAGEVLSPYLTLTSIIAGNTGYLTAKETTPLGSLAGMSDSEQSVGHALSGYQGNAVTSDASSARAQTLDDLFYQNEETSRNVMKQLTSSDRAQLINVNPLSAMTTGAVYDRLDTALYDGNINVTVPMNSFDGVPASMQVSTPVTLDLDHNFWFKLLRGFEYYGGTDGGYDLHNKSFGGVIGYDKAVNATTRLGGLFSYAKTDYNTDVMSGDSHDWRIGVYASHDNGTWKTQGMLSYGQNRYDFNRYIPYYGDKLSSDYDAKVFDVDAKVTYLPQENRAKSWQVAPYGRLSYTHASQGAYTEEGSSVFAQDMDSASNSSFRAEAGVEWKHQMDKTSSWGGSVGYKRILSGANPELNGTFAGDANGFTLSGDNDKNYVTYSVNLNKNTGSNWTVQGELRGEMSGHNHSEVYSLMAKHAF